MGQWRPLPAIYLNQTLTDLELQTVLVREAEAKWRQCVEDRRDAEAALVEARTVEARAKQFLVDAQAALEKYRRPAAPAAPPPAALPPGRRRALPKPRRGGG